MIRLTLRTVVAIAFAASVLGFAQMPQAAAAQKCWSAKNCSGKVLSNRDCHNCKVKSKGKSWSNVAGTCYTVANCP